MKTLNIIPFLVAIFLLIITQLAFSSDGKYEQAMKKNIEAIYTAQSIEELQQSTNAFERIANTEKNKWEPNYYAAFGYIMMANREKEASKKDVFLDQAMALIEKCKAIVQSESEVIALEGFVYMMRVTVDPASRGQQYAGMAMQTFGKAIGLNPENPRPIILLAQMQYGTAEFFGSSTDEACGTLSKALEKFNTFKSENPFAPSWGKTMGEGLKAKCK